MKVERYVSIAEKTDRLRPTTPTNPGYKMAPILGLAGEIGGLLTELKKMKREPGRAGRVSRKRIEEELGDAVWYAAAIARRAGLDFQRGVLFKNLKRVARNPGFYMPSVDVDGEPRRLLQKAIHQNGDRTVATFKDYQVHAAKSAASNDRGEAELLYLSNIWKNVGDLLKKTDAKTNEFSSVEKRTVSQVLGDVMWYIAGFATLYGLNLNTIARQNCYKAMSKFAPEESRNRTPHHYDRDFPIREQFPKQFDVVFARAPSKRNQTVMLINGVRVGDPLQDNAYQLRKKKTIKVKTDKGDIEVEREAEIEGYRFHDAIHLAFVAMLNWSPVVRDLMKLKRKSREQIDDAEDGARARIVEEMVVKLTHTYAKSIDEEKLLDGKKFVDFDLLKQIKSIAAGLEVTGSRKQENLQGVEYWEWEEAILAGFHIYNELRRHRKGRVRLNLHKRTLEFIKLKVGEEDIFPSIE